MDKILYRIEKDGIGPYRQDNELRPILKVEHCNPITHPGPYSDLYWPNKDSWPESTIDWYYAFPSLRILEKWFEGFLDKLLEIGFKIVQYRVNIDYIFNSDSGKQVLFKKEFAEQI